MIQSLCSTVLPVGVQLDMSDTFAFLNLKPMPWTDGVSVNRWSLPCRWEIDWEGCFPTGSFDLGARHWESRRKGRAYWLGEISTWQRAWHATLQDDPSESSLGWWDSLEGIAHKWICWTAIDEWNQRAVYTGAWDFSCWELSIDTFQSHRDEPQYWFECNEYVSHYLKERKVIRKGSEKIRLFSDIFLTNRTVVKIIIARSKTTMEITIQILLFWYHFFFTLLTSIPVNSDEDFIQTDRGQSNWTDYFLCKVDMSAFQCLDRQVWFFLDLLQQEAWSETEWAELLMCSSPDSQPRIERVVRSKGESRV